MSKISLDAINKIIIDKQLMYIISSSEGDLAAFTDGIYFYLYSELDGLRQLQDLNAHEVREIIHQAVFVLERTKVFSKSVDK